MIRAGCLLKEAEHGRPFRNPVYRRPLAQGLRPRAGRGQPGHRGAPGHHSLRQRGRGDRGLGGRPQGAARLGLPTRGRALGLSAQDRRGAGGQRGFARAHTGPRGRQAARPGRGGGRQGRRQLRLHGRVGSPHRGRNRPQRQRRRGHSPDARAARRGRRDHAVELPGRAVLPQGGAGAPHRQYGGAEAERGGRR